MRVLAIFAHPDDLEINCGGSLALHAMQGDTVYGLVLCDGALGGDATIRRCEAIAAAHVLGLAHLHFLNLPDGELLHSGAVVQRVRERIEALDPQVIYTHASADRHQDHVNAHHIVVSAVGKRPIGLLMTEGVSTLDFVPGMYTDITAVMRQKLRALRAHASQCDRGSVGARDLLVTARFRGVQVGVRYAEAFVPHQVRWFALGGISHQGGSAGRHASRRHQNEPDRAGVLVRP